jgi:hypothetical protein
VTNREFDAPEVVTTDVQLPLFVLIVFELQLELFDMVVLWFEGQLEEALPVQAAVTRLIKLLGANCTN